MSENDEHEGAAAAAAPDAGTQSQTQPDTAAAKPKSKQRARRAEVFKMFYKQEDGSYRCIGFKASPKDSKKLSGVRCEYVTPKSNVQSTTLNGHAKSAAHRIEKYTDKGEPTGMWKLQIAKVLLRTRTHTDTH